MAVYLTFFYTKREYALRIGYIFVSSALAGAFGGLLAYGIGHMEGLAGQAGYVDVRSTFSNSTLTLLS